MTGATESSPLSHAAQSGEPRPVTVITGGSKGIGRALAFQFAEGGYDLLLIARNHQELAEAAKELSQHAGVEVHILALDLRQTGSSDQIEQYLIDRRLYCQNLVNNAGYGLAGNFHSHDRDKLLGMLDLNIRILTDLSHRFLPDMLERSQGGILNIASMGGLMPGPYQAAYYASKAYVISLSRAMAWETAGSGVHICALVPGPVRTDFHEVMGARSELYIRSGGGISAKQAARMGYTGFRCGKSLIIPGIVSQLGVIAVKFIPHDLLMPFMAWFLRARLSGRKHV